MNLLNLGIATGIGALYFAAGIATATLAIVVDGEPGEDEGGIVVLAVVGWPIALSMYLPVHLARRIAARRVAKPAPLEDD